jgi:hypothetical protein
MLTFLARRSSTMVALHKRMDLAGLPPDVRRRETAHAQGHAETNLD